MVKDIPLFRFLYLITACICLLHLQTEKSSLIFTYSLQSHWQASAPFLDFRREERSQEQGNAISHAKTFSWFLESDKLEVWLGSYLESDTCHKPIIWFGLWRCSERKWDSFLAPTPIYEITQDFTFFSRCKAQSWNAVLLPIQKGAGLLRFGRGRVWAACSS